VRRNPNNLGYRRKVATAPERDRCRERLARLTESSLDAESIQREAIAELRRVIGFDRWCCERHVVATMIAGADTHAMTKRLAISRHTVQDHLKSVFAKLGVRSRREVLARFSGATETTST
jgi:ATP/maltotriose-dependent transcriptional regulator MalT